MRIPDTCILSRNHGKNKGLKNEMSLVCVETVRSHHDQSTGARKAGSLWEQKDRC